jgi:hypothetical protein
MNVKEWSSEFLCSRKVLGIPTVSFIQTLLAFNTTPSKELKNEGAIQFKKLGFLLLSYGKDIFVF